jgi:hypothetical protein
MRSRDMISRAAVAAYLAMLAGFLNLALGDATARDGAQVRACYWFGFSP